MLIRMLILTLLLNAVLLKPSYAVEATEVESKASNSFSDVKIQLITSENRHLCHRLTTDDKNWQRIAFAEIPQNQRFCIRAWVNIDKLLLPENTSLLVGMLGASEFYWDNMLISRNGVIGDTADSEKPGVITTLVRIPELGLINDTHLLSGEISTFHVGQKLDSIGYVLSVVDESEIHDFVLMLSVLSAVFIGVSLILSIVFQLFYWLYQREISYQIFSWFCFTSAFILAAEQTKFWIDYTYNWHATRLSFIYLLTFISSFLLPAFYVFSYRLPRKKLMLTLITASLVVLSNIKLSYDQTSSLLFFGALVWTLAINIYGVIKLSRGQVNVFTLSISLLFLLFIPAYFTEFGFSIVFIFIVVTMLVSLIREMHINRIKALKAERVKTQLLKRNIQPHFLMNCLTQLMELIEVKPKSAVEFIAVLSDEFRQLSIQNDKQSVSLVDEIALCNKHLEIMSFRYQQKYRLNVTGDLVQINIPPSILHSQIENCFTHNEISSNRAFELNVLKRNSRIVITLKTPIEKRIDHEGTGLGERYINAVLAEADEIKYREVKISKNRFESFEEDQYWISVFELNA